VTIRGSSSKKLLVFHFVKSQLLVLLWLLAFLVFKPHSSSSLMGPVIAEATEWCRNKKMIDVCGLFVTKMVVEHFYKFVRVRRRCGVMSNDSDHLILLLL